MEAQENCCKEILGSKKLFVSLEYFNWAICSPIIYRDTENTCDKSKIVVRIKSRKF